MIKISAIILTHNDEDVIPDCLASVSWTDEIIVVDHCSADGTIGLLEKSGVKKIVRSLEKSSFAERRNLGAENAAGQWLLYVDSDERVTPLLKKEIEERIKNPEGFSAFAIPRRNVRLTKELRWGGWWPDYVLRLIKKEKLVGWEGELHEQPKIEGRVGNLKEGFVHFSHRGKFEHKLNNTIVWSKIEAKKLFEANHPQMNTVRFFSAMAREFYFRMIKKQAFRDGLEGIIEAVYQVFSVFITYARLWEMQQKEKK